MVRQGFGHIINTASMAGLVPSPSIVNYTAAKHAVVGLSLSLRAEAATFGVRVSVICPGVIRTAILEHGGRFGKYLQPVSAERMRATFERTRPMEPARFAKNVLAAVARNRAIIIEPKWWKILWWFNRLSPWFGELMARKGVREFRKMLDTNAAELGQKIS
jgi:short-subunit dehydrogenase